MQSKTWLRLGSAFGLALTVLVAGCERGNVSAPEATGPVAGARVSAAGVHMMRSAMPGKRKVAVRLIGAEGGTIELSGHRLRVPAGAVSEPTLFKVTTADDQTIKVDLLATRRGTRGRDEDVGSRGFTQPVTLEITYASAQDVGDPGELAIAWVKDDGTIVPLPSAVNRDAQTVSADLEHFSGYALVSGRQ
jgi:hypothetical protein